MSFAAWHALVYFSPVKSLSSFLAVLVLALSAHAQLTASFDAKLGVYSVTDPRTNLTFSGTVPGRVEQTRNTTGRDAIGAYHGIQLRWTLQGDPVRAEIRTYAGKRVALFRVVLPHAVYLNDPISFPDFTQQPGGLHTFSYADQNFAPPQFSVSQISAPWLLFDDHLNAAILSPADHFQVLTMRGDGRTRTAVSTGLNLHDLSANFEFSSLLVIEPGIHRAFRTWGEALTHFTGKQRPSNEADDTLKYLGYWTDNGASYYYDYDPKLGYAGTLLAELQHLREVKIPIGYLQLDSWWYQKDSISYDGTPLQAKGSKFPPARWNVYGGIWSYTASPDLFPAGLAAFREQAGIPLVVHSRWMSQRSPYHQKYEIAGVAPLDRRYWDEIAAYLHANGVETYEQDWLDRIRNFSDFDAKPERADKFFANMSAAMAQQGLTMQYCMATPNEFLEAARFSNLTTIRTSDDHFLRDRRVPFIFDSELAEAIGSWPWADVADSTDRDAILLQTLSGGPVGFGDARGHENRDNLIRAVRSDGAIIKPDAPIVPLDRSYRDAAQHQHTPLLAATYTDHNGVRTAYVYALAPTSADRGPVQFVAADLGLSGAMFVYDVLAKRGERVAPGKSFKGGLGADDSAFYIVAPITHGAAFLGDENAYVGTGKMRIPVLRPTPKGLAVRLEFANSESSATVFGYASAKPAIRTTIGRADEIHYDPQTQIYRVTLHPDESRAEFMMTNALP